MKKIIHNKLISTCILIFTFSLMVLSCNVKEGELGDKEGINLLLLIDESQSMKKVDLYNQRDEAAKYWFNILQKNNKNKNNKIGIIRFANEAYVSKKLEKVIELSAIQEKKQTIDNKYTFYDQAFKLASDEFEKASGSSRNNILEILIVSDGKIINSAKEFKRNKNENKLPVMNKFEKKLNPVINKLKSKGCIIHILLIHKSIDSKHEHTEEQKVWTQFAEKTGGSINTIIGANPDELNKAYTDISYKIFGYSILDFLDNLSKNYLLWVILIISIIILTASVFFYIFYRKMRSFFTKELKKFQQIQNGKSKEKDTELKKLADQVSELKNENEYLKSTRRKVDTIMEKLESSDTLQPEDLEIISYEEKKLQDNFREGQNFFIKKDKSNGITCFNISLESVYQIEARYTSKTEDMLTKWIINFYKTCQYFEESFEYLEQEQRFNDRKDSFLKLGIKKDSATQNSFAKAICHFIKEGKYDENLFEDIIIMMEIFREKSILTQIFNQILELLREFADNPGPDFNLYRDRREEIEKIRKLYNSYVNLLNIDENNVFLYLSNAKKAIKAIKKISYLPNKGEKIFGQLSSIYTKLEPVFLTSTPDTEYLLTIGEYYEMIPRDNNDPHIKVYKDILKAIKMYILQANDPLPQYANLIINLYTNRKIYYSEIAGTNPEGFIVLPLYIKNTGRCPALIDSIEVIPETQEKEETQFRIRDIPIDERYKWIIYPTSYSGKEESYEEMCSSVLPIKLNTRGRHVSDKELSLTVNLKISYYDYYDYYEKNYEKNNPQTKEVNLSPLSVFRIPRTDKEIEKYNNGFYVEGIKKIICERFKLFDFIERTVDKGTSNFRVINIFGNSGVGKSTFIKDFNDRKKDKYIIIPSIDDVVGKIARSDNNKPIIIFFDNIESSSSSSSFEKLVENKFDLLNTEIKNIFCVLCGKNNLNKNSGLLSKQFLNDLISKQINFLDEKESEDFFSKNHFSEYARKFIMKETGGHPGLLNNLCCELVKSKQGWKFERPLDFWDVESVSKTIIKEDTSAYLKRIWKDDLDEFEKEALRILAEQLNKEDTSLREIKKPMLLTVGKELVKRCSLNTKAEDSTDIIGGIIKKEIVRPVGNKLEFRINQLKRWICKYEIDTTTLS
ncbi:MAG: VWA domain-containing protein [Desulfobacterales bacterium]|nr:VWA domain-containing protein [Desulfobacterales bacterium]